MSGQLLMSSVEAVEKLQFRPERKKTMKSPLKNGPEIDDLGLMNPS